MGRAPCCDKATVKRGPWSPDEDAVLRNYVEKHGTVGNWIALPQKAGLKRCGKSCRLRWLNYLRPDIKHGGFTEEEDRIICALYNEIGSRWSVIASHMPGRTDNDVKNYWNTKLKKKLMAVQISPPTNIASSSSCASASASTSTSTARMHHSPSPTPLAQPPLLPTIKTEDYCSGAEFSLPLERSLDANFSFAHDSQKLYSEIARLSMTGPMELPDFSGSASVSPSEDASAASSSSVTVDNSSSNGYMMTSDALLSELAFGQANDFFFDGYGFQERIGEAFPYNNYSNLANSWAAQEFEPQESYQSVAYS